MNFPRLHLWLCAMLLSATLPLSAAILHPCSTIAQASRTVGRDGRDGDRGQDGRDGRNGRDTTVRATGEPLTLEMAGEDGDEGRRGSDASQPNCDTHNRPRENVEAADGGDGGDGGRGGHGGNGGNLTVYYQDLNHLRNLYVLAGQGRGGRGGEGGYATEGCNCSYDSWEEETCQDGSCQTERFSCEDGEDGQRGDYGQNGNDGQPGRVRLVGQLETVPGDRPSLNSAIAQLPTTPINLSVNRWESRTGANALFASGSVVDDRYELYAGRIERQFQLIWESDLAQSRVNASLGLALTANGQLSIGLPEDLWLDGERTDTETLTTFRVRSALRRSEALQMALGQPRGDGRDFQLSVIDRASLSDVVGTQFHLRYKVDEGERRPLYRTRYEAPVPSELIEQNHNRFNLRLGNLPIDQRYLQSGSQVRIELIVIRSYAGNSGEQVLSWNGQL
ncbi:MAG: collagen-like protein [Cyanobacteria bacterium P01_A01_bin.105]